MLKRAAMQLATLTAMDRSWLLSQLSPDERDKLQPLIDEAMALGMHRDPAVLDALSYPPESGPIPPPPEAELLADVLALLPTYWRQVASGPQLPAHVGTSEFLGMLTSSHVGASALRRALVELAMAKRGSAHV